MRKIRRVRPGVSGTAVAAISLLVLAGTALTNLSAPAAARSSAGDVGRAGLEAQTSVYIPPFVRNTARRWMKWPPRRVVTRVGKAVIKYKWRKWVRSRWTDCEPPFPRSFCSRRLQYWGLGQAYWYKGAGPGVWNRPFSPRHEVSQALIPGAVYWLTCWRLGERVYGPYTYTNLWYRVVNGGYVSDALLYTGTDDVIPGVDHC